MFATNFENRLNGKPTVGMNNPMSAAGHSSLQADSGAMAERRGLLDDDGDDEEDMIEFETRKNQ